MKEIERYENALDVYNQYIWYGYNREIGFKEWLERAIRIENGEEEYFKIEIPE